MIGDLSGFVLLIVGSVANLLFLFDALLEAVIAVEAGGNTQTKKVGSLLRASDIQEVVVFDAQVLDDWHVVEIVAKRCTHRGRSGELG